MSSGGKRPGAGRKPRSTPLVGISVRVEDYVAAEWEAQKAAQNLKGPALLEKLLRVRPPRKARKPRTHNS